jgi:hypothetical protein
VFGADGMSYTLPGTPDCDRPEGRILVPQDINRFGYTLYRRINDGDIDVQVQMSNQPNRIPAIQSRYRLGAGLSEELAQPAYKTHIRIHDQNYG